MAVKISSDVFPAFKTSVQALWTPIFIAPIRASNERLVIGVAVFNDTDFHIEAANALSRLQCLYGAQAAIVIQVAGIALDELHIDLAARSAAAVTDFQPSITGISVGEIGEAEGISLQAIGVSWMASISSLYDSELAGTPTDVEDEDGSFEARFDASVGGDRLPKLVLDYVAIERHGLAQFFRSDLTSNRRRHRSHDVSIDFSGSKLVANFGTLKAGDVTRSVGLIKRRLWDLKVDRDSDTNDVFSRSHEMLVQMPSDGDPQISGRQLDNLKAAKEALETQADLEELRLEAFTSVAAIGNRVLQAEQSSSPRLQ